MPIALLDRRRVEAFFGAWAARSGPNGSTRDAARWLHQQLLDITLEEAPARPARRRLAITTSGVPVVYSYKCSARNRSTAFRMLAEPGDSSRTVEEQILLSRELLHRVADDLGWQRAIDRVDAVLDVLLPSDTAAIAEWHGGLGFGLEIDDGGPELRLYCNVRHGDLTSRWQRFADAMGELADASAEPAFREIVEVLAGPRAVPAGLALAIRGGALHGVRLYCGLLDVSADGAIAAAPAGFADSASGIRRFVESYRASFGDLRQQEITIGYDFIARGELLHPAVVRYKVDLWCEGTGRRDRARLLSWADDQMESLGLDRAGFQTFLADLDHAFDGCTLQYLSLGCRQGTEELTAYCIPGERAWWFGATRTEARRERAAAIDAAVEGGIAFLLRQRDASGWWSDFRTYAGASTEWVSAFVAGALARTNRPAAVAAARETWSRLCRARPSAEGWGYSPAVPSDADSTICALRLASAVGAPLDRAALQFLASHISVDGALTTYASEGPIRTFTGVNGGSFAGWCGPHTCVTAAGAALRELPDRQRVLNWLRGAQRKDGRWTSYWWTTPHYATALAAEALAGTLDPGDAERVSRAVRFVVSELLVPARVLTPFEQAFALRTLLLGSPESAEVAWMLGELTRAQRPDGSWASSAPLRIPPPDVVDPDHVAGWVDGRLGGGSIQVDWAGCFTTAAVLIALRCAEEHDALPHRDQESLPTAQL